MMFKDLTRHWSAFGVALMLTVALSNSSCCSTRKATEATRTEAMEQTAATEVSERKNEEKHAATLETESEGVTVTEIEVYDTGAAADPETGAHPVKARVRQRSNNKGTAKATETGERHEDTDLKSETTSNGKTLDEVTVTATKPPSLWERIKQGAGWATALVILAAAGWIIYKLKKQKTT